MNFLQNSISSIDFLVLVPVGVCILAGALVSVFPALRSQTGLLLISLVGTAGVYRRSLPGFLLIHLIAYLFVLGLARIAAASPQQRQQRWRWSIVAMLFLLVAFLAGRYFELETRPVTPWGISLFYFSLNMWAFLRLLTLLWELGSGRIEKPGPLAFVTWMALPFTLLGPILRYSQFSQQAPLMYRQQRVEGVISKEWWRKFAWALAQISLGLILTGLQVSLGAAENGLSRWQKLLIGFSLAPWSFYLLWAGYFKFMEGLAVFWGLNLPLSFNRPFGRRNLSEFWANWNMSATSVFRDYFFYNRWGLAKVNLYVNTMIVFLMVGVWHGLNGYWVLWGLLHGIGFCASLWYRSNQQRFARWQGRVSDARLHFAGPVATYLYVCSCWFLPPTILKFMR